MNLALHLFKKDLRNTRFLTCLWLALVFLQFLLAGLGTNPSDHAMQWLYGTFLKLLPMLQSLVLVLIIPLVIHGEPLVGTTAFWFTRPIERKLLLKAKGLFAVGLLFIPLIVEMTVLGYSGATARDLALALPEILMGQAATILWLALLAVLTRNFGQFAIAAAILIVISMVVSVVMSYSRLLSDAAEAMSINENLSLLKSRLIATQVTTIAVFLFIVVRQYLTRRTTSSLVLAAVSVVVLMTIQWCWPWDFMKPPVTPASAVPGDLQNVKLTMESNRANDAYSVRNKAELPNKNIEAGLVVTGAPPAYAIRLGKILAQLTTQDGTELALLPAQRNYAKPKDDQAIGAAFESATLLNPQWLGRPEYSLLTVSNKTYTKYRDADLRLHARVPLGFGLYKIQGALPVKQGARLDLPSARVSITDVLQQDDNIVILLQERMLNLLFSRTPMRLRDAGEGSPGITYVLHNPRRNEIYLPRRDPSIDWESMTSALASRIVNRTVKLEFGSSEKDTSSLLKISPEWLSEAQLVRLNLQEVTRLQLEITSDTFRLRGQEQPAGTGARPFDPVALGKIVLPENPSKQQARDYVAAILLVSREQNRAKRTDPQIEMLGRVGPENLDVLLEGVGADTGYDSFYLTQAISRIAREEDKGLIISHLATKTYLCSVIISKGWEEEARDILIAGLHKKQTLGTDWIKGVVALKDPETYDDLMMFLTDNSGMRHYMLGVLKKLPDFDMQKAVDISWDKVKNRKSYETMGLLPFAAEYGHADALGVAVTFLNSDVESERKPARKIFSAFTAAKGDDTALKSWYKTNKNRLIFNPETKKYDVSAEAP